MVERQIDKYIIIGFHKSGTTSLEKYMLEQGYDVIRHESLFKAGEPGSYDKIDGHELYYKYWSDRRPIMVMRDRVERVFSQYHYKQKHQKGDRNEIKETNIVDALIHHPEILFSSDYNKYIKLWEKEKPILVKFEEMIKWVDFPHETKCECKPKLLLEDREIIRYYLQKHKISY